MQKSTRRQKLLVVLYDLFHISKWYFLTYGLLPQILLPKLIIILGVVRVID